LGQDLREISKSFKVICDLLSEEFEKQHPYEGNFHQKNLLTTRGSYVIMNHKQ